MQDDLLHWMAIILSGFTFGAAIWMLFGYYFGWL